MQSSFCQISLNSRVQKPSSLKNKPTSTTNNDSKLSYRDSLQSVSPTHGNSTSVSQPARAVERRIQEIQAAQNLLSEKYQKVISNLILEINKKDQANDLLEREIGELTQELEESKKDLTIIVNYLKKKERKDVSNVGGKATLNSTKASQKLDKSVSGSKKKLELGCRVGYNEFKNKSPRPLFAKQTLNW